MFGKKAAAPTETMATPEPAAAPLPAKAGALKDAAPSMPARKPVIRPEVVRASREFGMSGEGRDTHAYRGYSGEGKKLIVGRDIALSGQISSWSRTGG